MAIQTAHLRVARPTDNINALLPFYCEGLGFEMLLRFDKHEDFDGVMIGHAGMAYHLEFTTKDGHLAGKAPTEDNLLVFYIPDAEEYKKAVNRMEENRFPPVPSFNPYWDRCGKTFEDADGYRVVLANRQSPTDMLH